MSSSPSSSPCCPCSTWRRRTAASRGQRPADALAYALVVTASLSLFWRRRAPIAVLAFVTAVIVVMYLRDYGAFLSVLGLPALYAVAAHEEHRRRAWWAMVASSVVA